MGRILTLALLPLALLSCNKDGERSLTLMTYNVGVFSKYMDDSTQGVADLILEMGADVVGLNELDSCNTRNNVNQVAALSDALGADWSWHFARAMAYRNGAYGNGVVTRQSITKRYRIALPKGEGSESRSVAVVETPDCVLGAAHLDHKNQDAALEQMRLINSWFSDIYGGSSKPVFLCGDFNVLPDSPVIDLAKTCWTQLSGVDYSFSTKNPSKCIDYCFCLKAAVPVQVESYRVLNEERAAQLSDHFPVLLKVKY